MNTVYKGRHQLLATAAILAVGAASLLAASLPATADQMAAMAKSTSDNASSAQSIVDVVRDPTDLPGPIGMRGPERIKVNLETVEVTGQLADGATYRYWTFDKKVPGPFVRVKVGDTVEVALKNADDSMMMHNGTSTP